MARLGHWGYISSSIQELLLKLPLRVRTDPNYLCGKKVECLYAIHSWHLLVRDNQVHYSSFTHDVQSFFSIVGHQTFDTKSCKKSH
ncbi:hypothetical protein J5N97_029963 [Dioscorea zingiberensis]|uniref:Uncharacterized protein n=1 Tax=Dioscorea zingiberensis TaxID=325984 RepID=A0A9D5BWT3_9LILI|nr:hypothetical protein J5N97_029963 [Dioscorea zingiberensis]